MANINDILGDVEGDDAFYDPHSGEMIPEGTYPAHIVSLALKSNIQLKNGSKADIYTPKYRLDKTAGKYADEEVLDGGIFRFKGESKGRRRGGGNERYKEFLDFTGIALEEVDVNGRKVIRLPSISEHDVFGAPVFITIYHDSFEGRNGKVTTERANIAHAWGDGEKLDPNDEVPF